MPTLERLCDSLTLHNTNMEFRLWLTCSPVTQFPMSLLQGSVKMTTDLLSGLKQRLLHSFMSEPISDEDFFYGCPGKDRAFGKLLYSLSFLHAVVQERLKYGHAGWNIPYEFTEVDFHISVHQLQMYINKYTDIPYDIIQYVVGECNYGGRLHDERDQRLLNNLVGDLINIRVAETPNYPLSSVGHQYHIPLRFEYHDFIVSIQALPDNPTAEVFGLNCNAEIEHNINVTQELFATLMLLQPNATRKKHWPDDSTFASVESIIEKLPSKVSSKSESTEDTKVKPKDLEVDKGLDVEVTDQDKDNSDFEIDASGSNIESLELELEEETTDQVEDTSNEVQDSSLNEARDEVDVLRPPDGLAIVLAQECKSYNNLLSTIRSSLLAFKGAFLGISETSEDIENLGFQLERNEIPTSWLKVSYSTSKTLGGYIDDLTNRLMCLKEWCCKGIQQEVWLPGLFCPQALLMTVLHQYSRTSNVPFHQLGYDHVVLHNSEAPEPSGLVVWGLHLQGAHWDHSLSTIQEQIPRVFFSEMPRIWFKPCLKSDVLQDCRYHCPVYTTTSRGEYVTHVMLHTHTPSHWVYRGVVLLCQLDN
ncbi:Dynein heavy chain 12, axonemal [Homalodisca vitripennis]|nr:Dynein heavy chain 12, axonemal [Homalodisca vitripennis]